MNTAVDFYSGNQGEHDPLRRSAIYSYPFSALQAIDELHAERLGHGYGALQDEQLYKRCVGCRIGQRGAQTWSSDQTREHALNLKNSENWMSPRKRSMGA